MHTHQRTWLGDAPINPTSVQRATTVTRTSAIYAIAVWLASVSVLIAPNLLGMHVHDEGFIATGAMLVANGLHPYSDFLSFYGPAQYYVLAALFRAFGEDLVVLRLLHVGWLALLIVSVWAISSRVPGATRSGPAVAAFMGLALAVYAKPNAGYPAIPATAFLFFAGVQMANWTGGRDSALGVASALIGVAGLFRWDFAVYGLVSIPLTVAFMTIWVQRAPWRTIVRSLLWVALPALLILAAVYGPLLALAGPRQWYQDIVAYAFFEFPKWRGQEFIRPAYWMGLRALEVGDVGGVFTALTSAGYVTVPAVLALTVLALTIRRAWLARRSAWRRDPNASVLYLTVLTCALLQQLRVRPDVWQGFPAMTAAMPLMVYLWAEARTNRLGRAVSSALVAGTLSILIVAAVPHARDVLRSDLVALDVDRARAIRVRPAQAHYGDLVRYVRAHTSADDRLYSGQADHSRLYICDSLIYFLAGRMPADRYMELEPGIANTAEGQRAIVEALTTTRPPLIVLLDWLSEEPNLTAHPNGIVLLDDYITRHYTPEVSFGPYTVLRRVE